MRASSAAPGSSCMMSDLIFGSFLAFMFFVAVALLVLAGTGNLGHC